MKMGTGFRVAIRLKTVALLLVVALVSASGQEKYDITGTWTYTVEGYGPSTYSFEPQGGGRYKFQQSGYGGASGIAVVTGRDVRINWTTPDGKWAGYVTLFLDETGTVGTGTSVVTKGAKPGTFKAQMSRVGAGRSASRDEEPSANEPADVEVLEVVGEVELAPGGDDSQAYPMRGGEQIDEADRIFTGMDSYAILRFRRDGHIVKVGQVTDAKVGVYRDEGTLVQYRILIRGGQVSCEVNKQTERPAVFEVKTPTATCGVRGTKFTVHHDEKAGVSAISVTEGAVEVRPENTSLTAFNLSANQRVEVFANEVSQITNITDSPGATTSQATPQPSAVSKATPQPSAAGEEGQGSMLLKILVGLMIVVALILFIRSRKRAA